MKIHSVSLPFLCVGIPVIAAITESAVSPHYTVACEIMKILSQTELVLNGCHDEKSVAEALPRLKELSRQMDEILAKQNALPDPNEEDTRQINTLVNQFATLDKAIQEHVRRLTKAELYSPELEGILLIRLD